MLLCSGARGCSDVAHKLGEIQVRGWLAPVIEIGIGLVSSNGDLQQSSDVLTQKQVTVPALWCAAFIVRACKRLCCLLCTSYDVPVHAVFCLCLSVGCQVSVARASGQGAGT